MLRERSQFEKRSPMYSNALVLLIVACLSTGSKMFSILNFFYFQNILGKTLITNMNSIRVCLN